MGTYSHQTPIYPSSLDYKPQHDFQGPPPQANVHRQLPPLPNVTAGHKMVPGQASGQSDYGPPPGAPPQSGLSPPHGPYISLQPYNNLVRRKPRRAAQACESCRQRKAKCDEGRPTCQSCRDNELECLYREFPPPKSEKQILAITGQLEAVTEDVKALAQLAQKSEEQGQKIDQLLNMLLNHLIQGRLTPTAPIDVSMIDAPNQNMVRNQARASPPRSPPQPIGFMRQDSTEVRAGSQKQNPPSATMQNMRIHESESLDTYMPTRHTTAAQNLLLWPSIKALIPAGTTSTYVMDGETGREPLRLYRSCKGKGEGDVQEAASSPAHSSSSDGRGIIEESSSSSHGVWGTGQLQIPLATQNQSGRDHPGGLRPSGGLMLDSEAVDKYFRSFMNNMHILHPVLDPRVLGGIIHAFKELYSWDCQATQQVVAIGNKRKRQTTDLSTGMPDYNRHQSRAYSAVQVPPIEHSVENAIVLLVLALGEITAHRDKLPDAASTAAVRTSTPHSAMYSDLETLASLATSPFDDQVNIPGVCSSPAVPQRKNMDVIPGLAYFSRAADILGKLPGGVDVSYIQAYLLAGLYMGQLARVIPSYDYINRASVATQILIQSEAYVNKTMEARRRNLINFAFWSCLQLESDIAAELELPLSGIGLYESPQHEEYPTNLTLGSIPELSVKDDLLRFYSYQIQLRTTINSVHNTLYRGSEDEETKPRSILTSALDHNLESWRGTLKDWDWDDHEHESPNINVARMRGKYYGAKYIIWRPTLRFALTQAAHSLSSELQSESPMDDQGSSVTSFSNTALDIFHALGQNFHPLRPDLLEGARKCIEAAIRGTTCFDEVPRRLVTTNIFGTAHA